jgi:hypothetical protein
MSVDETEPARRTVSLLLNSEEYRRDELEATYEQVWDTSELQNDFEVEGFLSPFVSVKRKSDGKKGTLMFQHRPRLYFSFSTDDE